MPGSRKMVRCVNLVDGRLKTSEVGAGAADGVVINGEPVGTTPKSCGKSAIVKYIYIQIELLVCVCVCA